MYQLSINIHISDKTRKKQLQRPVKRYLFILFVCLNVIPIEIYWIINIIFYNGQLRSPMRSVIKSKENLVHQVKRRFQFNPKYQESKSKIPSKPRNSQLITQKDDCQFSSVKEKNQVNDSSWLSKLVNGIQEGDNAQSNSNEDASKLESDQLQTKKEILYPTKKNSHHSICPVERKNSVNFKKSFQRKKSCSSMYSNGSKKHSCISINKGEKSLEKDKKSQNKTFQKKEKKSTPSKDHCLVRNGSDCSKTKGSVGDASKQNPQSLQRNSLISYSSIGLEQIEEEIFAIKLPQAEANEEQTSTIQKKRVGSPQKNKQKKRKSSIEKIVSRKSQEIRSQKKKTQQALKYKYGIQEQKKEMPLQQSKRFKYNIEEAEGEAEGKIKGQISPLKLFQNEGQENQGNQFIRKQWMDTHLNSLITKKEQIEIQSSNQFNTPKINLQTPLAKNNGSPRKNERMGKICKNKKPDTSNDHKPNNRELKYTYNVSKIPSVNHYKESTTSINQSMITIKKSIQPRQSIIDNIVEIQVTDPSKPCQFSYQTDQGASIFKKLNGNNQNALTINNCYEGLLTEQQRYEIGPIISKIKYMNRQYTESEFIRECKRINIQASRCSQKRNYQEDYIAPKQKLEKQKQEGQIIKRKTGIRRQNKKQYSYLQHDKENHYNQTESKPNETCNKASHTNRSYASQDKPYKKGEYSPLFPQNRYQRDHTTPNRSPYIEMPSIPDATGEFKFIEAGKGNQIKHETVKNIGNIIDSLNSKINRYIENNHLESTYRNFELDFVHLKQNLRR